MKTVDMAEGRGPNPYYVGNFEGESDELRDLRLTLVAERDALKAALEGAKRAARTWGNEAERSSDRYTKCAAELERIKALEPVAVRYDFDGYGWQYIDSGSGSDWLTRHEDGEVLYALRSET